MGSPGVLALEAIVQIRKPLHVLVVVDRLSSTVGMVTPNIPRRPTAQWLAATAWQRSVSLCRLQQAPSMSARMVLSAALRP